MHKTLLILINIFLTVGLIAQADSVKLTNFTGNTHDRGVSLSWTTESESNVQEFVVERSLDAIDFQPVGQTSSKGLSLASENYDYDDDGVYREQVYYRLRTIMAHKEEVSNIIAVVRNSKLDLPEIMIYPTVGNENVRISKSTEDELENAQIRVFNLNGDLVHSESFAGDFVNKNLDVSGYAAGLYVIELRDGKYASKTKFVKTNW
ncbi:MAG: T9SS type A sorting domain-containing protein [Aureispira sp.]|nr:T9SS type A sorting domain-containing protein [Aureispira sp.]